MKIKNNDHTIDTTSRFQWVSALSSERADSINPHLLETMAAMGIPTQIKTDNAPAYVSSKMKVFFVHYNIKHITGIPYNPTGQTVVKGYNHTPKELLVKQKRI